MQIRDSEGDPTPAGLVAGGAVVVVVAAGGTAAAASGSSWIPPIIALVGAVFVAILTAVTTNRRQSKQLHEEATRQSKQLCEERTRLKLELGHHRELGELAHLRGSLTRRRPCLRSGTKQSMRTPTPFSEKKATTPSWRPGNARGTRTRSSTSSGGAWDSGSLGMTT